MKLASQCSGIVQRSIDAAKLLVVSVIVVLAAAQCIRHLSVVYCLVLWSDGIWSIMLRDLKFMLVNIIDDRTGDCVSIQLMKFLSNPRSV
jgi:hypothetical protein